MRVMLMNEDLFRTFAFEEGCFGEAVDEEYSSIYYGPLKLAEDHGLRGAFITIPRGYLRTTICVRWRNFRAFIANL
ncbi:hypothetical protein A2U01_0062960 [Trifolium medium]|uniref:Uncharacterized protein n=1 Tax=Trifolium medium TaxID=97028 RepID=A0A392S1L6_9FABA|nr:hypothetical protein [Trifolium medium]